MTAEDVAETLGVSADQVYRTARRFGLTYRRRWVPLTAREEKRIVELTRAGLNVAAIKDRLDVSRGAIRRIRKAAGLTRKGGARGADRVDHATHVKIARMHLVEGRSYGDICLALGVTRGVVAGAIYRARRQKWKLSARVEKEVEAV